MKPPFLFLSGFNYLIQQNIQIAIQYLFNTMNFYIEAVVGDAIVGEVVGADLFRTVGGADQLLASGAQRGLLLQ